MSQSHTRGSSFCGCEVGEGRSPVKGDPFKIGLETPLVLIECDVEVGCGLPGVTLSTVLEVVDVSVGSKLVLGGFRVPTL